AVNNRIAAPISCGGCSLLTGITVMAAQGFSADGVITYLCESIIGVGCACFLSRLSFPKGFFKGNEPLDLRQLSGSLVFLCMLVMSAERLVVGGISLSHIAAAVIILISAKLTGVAGGCISGGTMGFAVSLAPSLPFIGAIYTFSGLAAGLLARYGRLLECVGFVGACAVSLMINKGDYELMPIIYELIISVVAFLLIPKRFFDVNAKYFVSGDTVPEFETLKKALLLELESVSEGLDEVAQAVDRIAGEMVKLENSGEERGPSGEIKQLVRDQFATLSTAMREIAQNFSKETRFDTGTGAKVSAVLAGYGITPKEVVCSATGKSEKIDIKAEKINSKISRTALIGDIENVCGYRLSIPSVKQAEDSTVIRFEKKPEYNLRIGQAQRIAEGKMCGDSCDNFDDKYGNKIVIISDGMGTGPKAAVDGTVAAWLFSKLIAAGLGFESSLRLANSALIVKSAEESLATIDSLRVDLNTGKADFFKAGAGITLVCKGKRVYKIGKPSMPLGILRDVEFDRCEMSLKNGDKVLMMSDGIPTQAHDEIAENLRRFNKNDPSDLAEKVVQIAEKYSKSKHPDDMTAVAVIVG
ncbi:MAG: SpoIIE family protein phosphatase, partial [Clostridia bacterium]|nr:SpoIIE family protein phosphatase [Clostridia bacterium]